METQGQVVCLATIIGEDGNLGPCHAVVTVNENDLTTGFTHCTNVFHVEYDGTPGVIDLTAEGTAFQWTEPQQAA